MEVEEDGTPKPQGTVGKASLRKGGIARRNGEHVKKSDLSDFTPCQRKKHQLKKTHCGARGKERK